MNKTPLRFVILVSAILQIVQSSCVNDAASLQDVYTLIKNKSVKDVTRKEENIYSTIEVFNGFDFDSSMMSLVFAPLEVIDISEEIQINQNFIINEDYLKNWEKTNGKLLQEACVLIKTNHRQVQFNGWDNEALEYLFKKRNVTALGHDQLSKSLESGQQEYFETHALIEQSGDIGKNTTLGGLIQIRKGDNISDNKWKATLITIAAQEICSIPRRLMSQWGSVLTILVIFLALIALIWYFCLKRFDKYNKEQFQLPEWENRNQEQIYYDKKELDVPLSDFVNTNKPNVNNN